MRLSSILGLLHLASASVISPRMSASEVQPVEPSSKQWESHSYWNEQALHWGLHLCIIGSKGHGHDDGPSIVKALTGICKQNALVIFPSPLYNIKTPMTTMNLKNVRIEQFGKLLWSDDIDYWLGVSMPIGFQNQSTVWYFGGDNVYWDGHFRGTFDGNGQAWYDWNKNQGNSAHRPMNINWRGLTNSKVHRLRFVQSQMWTMATSYSHNVEFDDIYVNSTSTSQWNTLNTDGCDTINSDRITFRRWKVSNGDDAIALKGNSTNIAVYDSEFWHGQGFAIGSVGQSNHEHDIIKNFYAKNTILHDTTYVLYLKSWGGVSNGYPPNGGGGGLGSATNIVVDGAWIDQGRTEPFFLWQCENYSGQSGKDCDSSKFHFGDVTFKHISGTMVEGVKRAAWFECSAGAGGCSNFRIEDFRVRASGSHKVLSEWACSNVHDAKGFKCNAPADSNASKRSLRAVELRIRCQRVPYILGMYVFSALMAVAAAAAVRSGDQPLCVAPVKCTPGSFACVPVSQTGGSGWEVCDTSGSYVYGGDCPLHTICQFDQANQSPFCVSRNLQISSDG